MSENVSTWSTPKLLNCQYNKRAALKLEACVTNADTYYFFSSIKDNAVSY